MYKYIIFFGIMSWEGGKVGVGKKSGDWTRLKRRPPCIIAPECSDVRRSLLLLRKIFLT